MAYIQEEHAGHGPVSAIGDAIWSLFKPLKLTASADRRAAQVQNLSAKSDAELAEMGIKREDIPRIVFRDLYYV